MSVETTTIRMPVDWAVYLINGDASGWALDADGGDAAQAECDRYAEKHLYADGWRVVGVSEDTNFAWWGGYKTEVAEYALIRSPLVDSI